MNRKITFQDFGQDFLWWIIDDNGLVIDCGPFQYQIWVGSIVDVLLLEIGNSLYFTSKSGDYLKLNYLVESIELV